MSDPLWHRQPDERGYHFVALSDYLALGSRRSLAALHRQYQRQADGESTVKPPTHVLRTLEIWSSRFGWVARASAYDEHLKIVEHEEIEQRAREWVRRELDDAEAMLGRWNEAWESTPYHEQDVVREINDPQNPGQKMRVVVVKANVNKMRNLTGWRRDISDQGRRALNLPDRITESRQQHSGEISTGENWVAFLAALKAANEDLEKKADEQGDAPPEWD